MNKYTLLANKAFSQKKKLRLPCAEERRSPLRLIACTVAQEPLEKGGELFPRKVPRLSYFCETTSPARVRAVPTTARGVMVSWRMITEETTVTTGTR